MSWWPFRRRKKLYALLAFRNEMRFLPDYFENVSPHVDGVIALDDGSTDGSGAFVASQPNVLELISKPPVEPHDWDDADNHRRLVEASWRHGAEWVLGLDADERIEIDFRERADRIIRSRRARAYGLHLREIWDDPLQFRVDGVWGRKVIYRLFEARRDHQFHDQKYHCYWAPVNSQVNGQFVQADLMVYHLRMQKAEDRAARRARYEALDPRSEFQSIGYAYLTDETGAEFRRIDPARTYRPVRT